MSVQREVLPGEWICFIISLEIKVRGTGIYEPPCMSLPVRMSVCQILVRYC